MQAAITAILIPNKRFPYNGSHIKHCDLTGLYTLNLVNNLYLLGVRSALHSTCCNASATSALILSLHFNDLPQCIILFVVFSPDIIIAMEDHGIQHVPRLMLVFKIVIISIRCETKHPLNFERVSICMLQSDSHTIFLLFKYDTVPILIDCRPLRWKNNCRLVLFIF